MKTKLARQSKTSTDCLMMSRLKSPTGRSSHKPEICRVGVLERTSRAILESSPLDRLVIANTAWLGDAYQRICALYYRRALQGLGSRRRRIICLESPAAVIDNIDDQVSGYGAIVAWGLRLSRNPSGRMKLGG